MTKAATLESEPKSQKAKPSYIKWFREIGIEDVPIVGGSSGVIFTIDTETGFRDAVLINASYGLGENVVKGFVNPDEFCVFKPTLKTGFRPILQKVVGSKELKLVYDTAAAGGTRNIPVPPQDRRRFSISDDEILQLARWACIIEEHCSAKRGRPTPMDVEFAKDGRTGGLFILQARPETVESRNDATVWNIIASSRAAQF